MSCRCCVLLQVLPAHLGGTGQLIQVQEGWQRILQQREQLQTVGGFCERRGVDCSQEAQQQQELRDIAPQLRFSGPGSADAAVVIQTA